MILYNTKQQEVTGAVLPKSSSDRYFSIAILSSLHRRFSSEVFHQRIEYLDYQKSTYNLYIYSLKYKRANAPNVQQGKRKFPLLCYFKKRGSHSI